MSIKVRHIAVDFDGVITHYDGHYDPYKFGEPNESIRFLLTSLKKQGYKIVVFTCRTNGQWENHDYKKIKEAIEEYLTLHDIPYDRVATQMDGKVFATAYIDDKAIHWQQNYDDLSYAKEQLDRILSLPITNLDTSSLETKKRMSV